MKKNVTAAVLSLALIGSLAACSSGSASSPTSGGSDELSGTVSMLTPLFATDADKAAFKTALKRFNTEHPKVEVKIDYTDYSKLNEKISTALASGLLPDILQIGVGWVPPLAGQKVLAPLDKLGVSAESLTKDFPAAAAEAAQYDGHVYAVPLVSQGLQLVYRKDLFKEAGLNPDKPPTTWAELRADAVKLTKRSGGKLQQAGMNVLTDNIRQNFETFLFSNGGSGFSKDGEKATFNSSKGVAALGMIDDLVNKDKVVDVGFESGAAQNPILSGKAAMGLYGANIPCDQPVLVDPAICKQFGYAPIPGRETGAGAVFLGGTMSAVTAASKNPKAAAALVKFMSSDPEVAFSTTASTYSIPSATASWKDKRVTGSASATAFIRNIDKAGTEGGPVSWLDIRNDFQPALESVIVGGTAPKTALNQLADKADASISSAR